MRVSPENLKAIATSGNATAMANALTNAARHMASVHQALITEQELTERFTWLLEHPDEFCSALNDAYNRWDGEYPGDFQKLFAEEVYFQKHKEYPLSDEPESISNRGGMENHD